jgi:Asp/Glu/hydantoin racemase
MDDWSLFWTAMGVIMFVVVAIMGAAIPFAISVSTKLSVITEQNKHISDSIANHVLDNEKDHDKFWNKLSELSKIVQRHDVRISRQEGNRHKPDDSDG